MLKISLCYLRFCSNSDNCCIESVRLDKRGQLGAKPTRSDKTATKAETRQTKSKHQQTIKQKLSKRIITRWNTLHSTLSISEALPAVM